jgi:hypothetical protein
MSKSHSRRAVLTGIATAPALAGSTLTLAGATALSLRPDPIFAAIERHRATWAELNTRCSALSDAGTPEAEAELDRIMDADGEAAGELAGTEPMTLAGAIALLRYVAECDDYSFEDEEDGKTKLLSYFIQRNVADAIETIGGVS